MSYFDESLLFEDYIKKFSILSPSELYQEIEVEEESIDVIFNWGKQWDKQ